MAITILSAILLGLAFAVGYSVHYNAFEKMALELTPEVLVQKAREIVARLGYEGRPADSAYDIDLDGDFQNAAEKSDKPHPDWNVVLAGRPTLLHLWYRQSPDTLVADGFRDNLLTPGIVTEQDPPTVLSGMIDVQLDMQGRLIYFQAIPRQKLDNGAPTSAPNPAYDWSILFNDAGLDLSKFQPVTPAWNSLAASDTRMAWTGTWPGITRPLRVEAAAFQGKPVFFSLIGDWTKPDRTVSTEKKSLGQRMRNIVQLILLLVGLSGAVFLARRNYRHGRGDRKGALRLAIVMFALLMGIFLCRAHFSGFGETIYLTIMAISTALFISSAIWVLYMAIEPWVRRQWPTTIISWSRLLAGSWRDPVVGRDIMVGVALGVLWILVFQIRYIPMMRMGAFPGSGSTDALMGGRAALGGWLRQWPQSIQTTLLFFLLLLGLRRLLRNQWIAAIVFVAIFAVPQALSSRYWQVELPAQTLIYSIAVLIVIRFGLVPLAIAIFTINMMSGVPFSADLSTWYTTTSIAALLSVVALAGWGFYHSLGGNLLWKVEEEE